MICLGLVCCFAKELERKCEYRIRIPAFSIGRLSFKTPLLIEEPYHVGSFSFSGSILDYIEKIFARSQIAGFYMLASKINAEKRVSKVDLGEN